MVALTVAESAAQNEWHLPTYDPKNDAKYHYKLHALDIYFWTQQDALQFINGVRRVLPPAQVQVLDEPAPPPMASVVQKLETAAISDPAYSAVNQSPQDAATASSAGSAPAATNGVPPPPPGPPPGAAPANFAPMAYNPAAPAAPESIQHREKTPPPDEDPLNPLAVAVAHDYQGQPFTPGLPPPQFPLSPGFAPQAIAAARMPGGVPPGHGLHRSTTMPLASPSLNGSFQAQMAMPSSFAPPPTTHSSNGFVPPPPPPPPQQQQQTYGSFSNQSARQPQAMDYSIHQQVYRPTESESAGGHKPHAYVPKQEPKGKVEENVGRLEKGVSGMLKKFEKKFG